MNTPILLTLNLLEDSILLNEGVLDALDWPRQVQIMINKDEKMLLLRACNDPLLQKLIGAYDADYPIAQREEAGTNAPTEV